MGRRRGRKKQGEEEEEVGTVTARQPRPLKQGAQGCLPHNLGLVMPADHAKATAEMLSSA